MLVKITIGLYKMISCLMPLNDGKQLHSRKSNWDCCKHRKRRYSTPYILQPWLSHCYRKWLQTLQWKSDYSYGWCRDNAIICCEIWLPLSSWGLNCNWNSKAEPETQWIQQAWVCLINEWNFAIALSGQNHASSELDVWLVRESCSSLLALLQPLFATLMMSLAQKRANYWWEILEVPMLACNILSWVELEQNCLSGTRKFWQKRGWMAFTILWKLLGNLIACSSDMPLGTSICHCSIILLMPKTLELTSLGLQDMQDLDNAELISTESLQGQSPKLLICVETLQVIGTAWFRPVIGKRPHVILHILICLHNQPILNQLGHAS